MNAHLATRNLNLRRRWSAYQHALQTTATFEGSQQRRIWVDCIFRARMRESRHAAEFGLVSIAGGRLIRIPRHA